MTAEAAIFTCSICGERSAEICVYCTKDACSNHRCDRCKRCSDCCECEIPLSATEVMTVKEVELQAEPPIQTASPELQVETPTTTQAEPPPESLESGAVAPQPESQSKSEPESPSTEDPEPPHPQNPIF